MLACAQIPLCDRYFDGLISALLSLHGRQLVFAIYNGAKFRDCGQSEGRIRLFVSKGDYRLYITVSPQKDEPLAAPKNGGMSRTVRESLRCSVQLRLENAGRTVYFGKGINGSFEKV